VAALEAAFLTRKVSKLALHEPPVQKRNREASAQKMERLIDAGKQERALITFLREIVMVSPSQLAAMKRDRRGWHKSPA